MALGATILHQRPVHWAGGGNREQCLTGRAAALEVQAKRIVIHAAVAKRTPKLVIRRYAQMDYPVGDRLERIVCCFGRGVDDGIKEISIEKLGLVELHLARLGDAQRAIGSVPGESSDAVGHVDHPVAGHKKAGIAAAGKSEILQNVSPEPLLPILFIAFRRHGIRLVGQQQRLVSRRDA